VAIICRSGEPLGHLAAGTDIKVGKMETKLSRSVGMFLEREKMFSAIFKLTGGAPCGGNFVLRFPCFTVRRTRFV
jgi:hypothetical protein